MHSSVQVKAEIPRELKRRAFAALALREERFNHWLRTQMEAWLDQVEGNDKAMVVLAHGDAGSTPLSEQAS